MITNVLLQDTETLQLALHVDPRWPDDCEDDSLHFMFTEGDSACDCNRALFFARALGVEEWIEPCKSRRFRIVGFDVERNGRRYALPEIEQ